MNIAAVLGAVLLVASACVPPGAATTAPPEATAQPVPSGARCRYVDGVRPDPRCTPGAIDPAVSQANLAATICTAGYTAGVRPPVSVTNPIKLQSMHDYGLSVSPAEGELDHLISLEIGGAPADPRNLWFESYTGPLGARVKDHVENLAHAAVCAGRMTLVDAQQQEAQDWIALGRSLGLPLEGTP